MPAPRTRWPRLLASLLAALVLGLVFAAYLAPGTVLDLSNRLWSCFG